MPASKPRARAARRKGAIPPRYTGGDYAEEYEEYKAALARGDTGYASYLVSGEYARYTSAVEKGTESRLVFKSAVDVQEEPVEFVWDKRMPRGAFCLSAGAGGSGKSVHAAWLAAELTRGTLSGCWEEDPKRVLWATIEASHEKEVKPRLMAAEADLSLVEFVTVQNGSRESRHIKIFNPEFLDRMHEKVRKDNVGMIVLDPALDVMDRINTKDQQEVRDAIAVVNAFAEEEDILILGLAHFNKMTSVDTAVDRITGSAAFSQRPRAVVAFAYDTESERYVVTQAKNNWGETFTLPSLAFSVEEVKVGPRKVPVIRLKWEEESVFSVDDILGRRNQQKESPKEDAARAWLETKLKSGPVSKGVLLHEAKSDGISWPAVQRAYRALRVISKKAQVEEGVKRRAGRPEAVWRLPPARLRAVRLPRHCATKRNDIILGN